MIRTAGRDENRSFNGSNDFERRNRTRVARQNVSAVGALLRNQKLLPSQPLKDLRQSLGRNAVEVRDILCAESSLSGMLREMTHRDESVVRFLREFQQISSQLVPSSQFPVLRNGDHMYRIYLRLFWSQFDSIGTAKGNQGAAGNGMIIKLFGCFRLVNGDKLGRK